MPVVAVACHKLDMAMANFESSAVDSKTANTLTTVRFWPRKGK